MNLEPISPLKLESNPTELNKFIFNDIKKVSNSKSSLGIKQEDKNSTRIDNILEKYKFKFDNEDGFSSTLNKSFSFNKNEETKLLDDKINSKDNSLNSSFIRSEIKNEHEDVAKTHIKSNQFINTALKHSETSFPKSSTKKSSDTSLENIGKIHQSPKSFFKSNSSDKIYNNNEILNDDNKSNSFSNDNSPSYLEKKESKTNDKRRSLGSLNLTHFNLSSKNESINKRIEEIRERLKLNEKQQEKPKENPSVFHFEANSESRIIPHEKIEYKLENHESNKLSNDDDNSDGTVFILFKIYYYYYFFSHLLKFNILYY